MPAQKARTYRPIRRTRPVLVPRPVERLPGLIRALIRPRIAVRMGTVPVGLAPHTVERLPGLIRAPIHLPTVVRMAHRIVVRLHHPLVEPEAQDTHLMAPNMAAS